MNICIYVIESPCYTPETNNPVNQLYTNNIFLKSEKRAGQFNVIYSWYSKTSCNV